MKKHVYTHRDSDGMAWRFEGSRPISELADRTMAAVGKELRGRSASQYLNALLRRDLAKTRRKRRKPRRGQRRSKAGRN